MSEEQRKRFIRFFEETFPGNVMVEERQEATKEVHPGERKMKSWSVDEYVALLGPEDNDTLAKKLKRTVMSVQMRRGGFIPDFAEWLKKKGLSYRGEKRIIEEYLSKRGDAL
ncbi:MAG: hypothetical protein QXH42_04610 [Thermoplasmata archaeon]